MMQGSLHRGAGVGMIFPGAVRDAGWPASGGVVVGSMWDHASMTLASKPAWYVPWHTIFDGKLNRSSRKLNQNWTLNLQTIQK